ncbi:hypothetical protein [uncultured Chitinophaga sp.]|jgi:hypothetical protein|uniref:hypothetical protein n=1 Tax=uncultured Chitinophaga sp. TaxID=339340 RepID=UPI002632589C|nr:hypothetical protein [uncultured Chitinophaga sp.]
MRKVLPIVTAMVLVVLSACKKEDNATPHRNFYGKWYYESAVFKEYTVTAGDTSYSRLDTLRYNGAEYIDFTQSGIALRFYSDAHSVDTFRFEEITPVFFHLDSLLCEATAVTDTALRYNTLDFSYDETPKVKISQTFYTLKK